MFYYGGTELENEQARLDAICSIADSHRSQFMAKVELDFKYQRGEIDFMEYQRALQSLKGDNLLFGNKPFQTGLNGSYHAF